MTTGRDRPPIAPTALSAQHVQVASFSPTKSWFRGRFGDSVLKYEYRMSTGYMST